MSSVEETIRQLLLDDDSVIAVVGDRIYPVTAPHPASAPTPFAVYQLIDAPENCDLDGTPNLAANRLQVSCISDTWASARDLLEAIRSAALAVKRGTYFGISLDSITVLDRRDMGFDDTTGYYRHDVDFEVVQQL